MSKLTRTFFERPTLEVAPSLLHKFLVFRDGQKLKAGEILEVEAYIAASDPASHGHRGLTSRSQVMAEAGGKAYVYKLYGHHCLNIVTEEPGIAAAVLIRSLRLVTNSEGELNGPGKVCRFLGVTLKDNGRDLTTDPDFYIEDRGVAEGEFQTTPRIGVTKAQEKLWRFVAISHH